jgi:pimeloyl-ACP methyl ester carboxylesterase
MLNMIQHPAETPTDQPPLLIAHGLYGSGRNWGVIARKLSEHRDVVAVDMRNHGASPRNPSHSYADLAHDLSEIIEHIGGRADVLGHSMGGKAAMQLALAHAALVRKLIVADIAPIAYSHDQSQYIRAMRALDLAGITGRTQADSRLEPLVPDAALRAFFLQSLDLKTDPATWRLNLDALEDQMPNIIGWPETAGQFGGPALFLTGAESHYVLPAYHPKIRALFPQARFAKLIGAGHWLHATHPRQFLETVQTFLNFR